MKVFTKALLIKANDLAILSRANRKLQNLQRLPEDQYFPVISHMLHNDREVRCFIQVGDKQEVTLDIPLGMFNRLPSARIVDGTVIVEAT